MGIRLSAATILVSRFGSAVMPQLSFDFSTSWLTTSAIKKRSLAICTAMGWISTPWMHFSIR